MVWSFEWLGQRESREVAVEAWRPEWTRGKLRRGHTPLCLDDRGEREARERWENDRGPRRARTQ